MSRPNLNRCAVLMLAGGLLACASTKSTTAEGESRPAPSETRAHRDPNVITTEELLNPAIRAQGVLEAIRLLRPNFLNLRGKASQSDPEAGRVHASIDGSSIISVDELRTMHVATVLEIRLLSVGAAMHQFGGAAREGPVILVKTM